MGGRSTNGTAYEVRGEGPTVALIHGLGLNRAMWQWQTPELVPHFRVLGFDLFGHGGSEAPPRKPGLTLFSEQLLGLMDHLHMERAAVVGFSLGGMIARRFALDHPDRLSAMAILHSAHDRDEAQRDAVRARVLEAREGGPGATAEAALDRWFTPAFRATEPRIPVLVRDWILANDPGTYPDIYSVLAEGDAEIANDIHRITCPTLVMTGEHDHGNSPDMARAMAARMPEARVVILPGLRHMALAESPRTFNAPLVGFLREVLVEE